MAHRTLSYGLALALLGLSAEAALGNSRWPTCRPYTVEQSCPPGLELCGLKMVYAHRQSPGADRYGYWYGIPHPGTYEWSLRRSHRVAAARPVVTGKVVHQPAVRKAVVRKRAPVMSCGYRCWYRHWPEHNLPFGD